MTATPATLASATAADQEPAMTSPDIPIEVIDGIECTNRHGLAAITGLTAKTMSIYAGTDEAFPAPIRGQRINRTYWYPLTDARRYAAVLAERADAAKPPAVAPGDPDDLLNLPDAAAAIGVKPDTMYRYVHDSQPYWDGMLEGRPILPAPDHTEEAERGGIARHWYRRTLAAHQEGRPGAYGNTAAGGARRGRRPSTS